MRHFYFDIFILLCAFVCGLLNLYAYCYFGQLTTNCYEKMAECLYEFNWYEKSLDLQKKILLMIQNMQQPVFYHGFGLAVLNLETFVKVRSSDITCLATFSKILSFKYRLFAQFVATTCYLKRLRLNEGAKRICFSIYWLKIILYAHFIWMLNNRY